MNLGEGVVTISSGPAWKRAFARVMLVLGLTLLALMQVLGHLEVPSRWALDVQQCLGTTCAAWALGVKRTEAARRLAWGPQPSEDLF